MVQPLGRQWQPAACVGQGLSHFMICHSKSGIGPPTMRHELWTNAHSRRSNNGQPPIVSSAPCSSHRCTLVNAPNTSKLTAALILPLNKSPIVNGQQINHNRSELMLWRRHFQARESQQRLWVFHGSSLSCMADPSHAH